MVKQISTIYIMQFCFPVTLLIINVIQWAQKQQKNILDNLKNHIFKYLRGNIKFALKKNKVFLQ